MEKMFKDAEIGEILTSPEFPDSVIMKTEAIIGKKQRVNFVVVYGGGMFNKGELWFHDPDETVETVEQ